MTSNQAIAPPPHVLTNSPDSSSHKHKFEGKDIRLSSEHLHLQLPMMRRHLLHISLPPFILSKAPFRFHFGSRHHQRSVPNIVAPSLRPKRILSSSQHLQTHQHTSAIHDSSPVQNQCQPPRPLCYILLASKGQKSSQTSSHLYNSRKTQR
jgi:hypothetical protein